MIDRTLPKGIRSKPGGGYEGRFMRDGKRFSTYDQDLSRCVEKLEDMKSREDSVEYRLVTITPEFAKELLSGNTNNRKLRQNVVDRYASDMKSGRWDENAISTISVAEDGTLKDGQHRLNAIVKSGKSIRFLLITGVYNDAHMYDRGASRSTSDVSKLLGLDFTPKEISCIKNFFWRIGRITNITDEQILEYTENHIEAVREAVKICNVQSKSRKPTKYMAAIACAYTLLRSGEPQETISRFIEVTNSGYAIGEEESAAITFRNQVLDATTTNQGFFNGWNGVDNYFNLMEKAYNDFSKKKVVKRKYALKDYRVYTDNVKKADSREIKRILSGSEEDFDEKS